MDFKRVMWMYEKILVGKATTFPRECFSATRAESDAEACKLIRTVLDDVFGWSPEEAANKLTYGLLRSLKLDGVLMYIILPPEARRKDMKIVATRIYPELTREVFSTDVHNIFHAIAHDRDRYPRGYFDDVLGFEKAQLLLSYAMRQLPPFSSLDELYKFMSGPEGRDFLAEYHLTGAQKIFYPTQLDYFYDRLDPQLKDEIRYNNCKVGTMIPQHCDVRTSGGWPIQRTLSTHIESQLQSNKFYVADNNTEAFSFATHNLVLIGVSVGDKYYPLKRKYYISQIKTKQDMLCGALISNGRVRKKLFPSVKFILDQSDEYLPQIINMTIMDEGEYMVYLDRRNNELISENDDALLSSHNTDRFVALFDDEAVFYVDYVNKKTKQSYFNPFKHIV